MTSTKKNYAEKLRDPRWQKRRLDILSRDNFTCQSCYSTEKTLHVHHKTYIRGVDPWDYKDDYLITLCEECHAWETENMPIAISAITELLKIKFSSECILSISKGLANYKETHMDHVCAAAISYFLGDEERSRFMVDEYLKSLRSSDEEPF
jgi:hypothetical protein